VSKTGTSSCRVARVRNKRASSQELNRDSDSTRAFRIDGLPFPPILRNVFKARVLRQSKCRSPHAPSSYTRKAIGAVSNHCPTVRNRLRLHPKFGDNTCFIAQDIASAVHLNHSCAHDTLTEIFIGVQMKTCFTLSSCDACRGSERIIRLMRTIGQTITPSAFNASSRIGNWESNSSGTPSLVL